MAAYKSGAFVRSKYYTPFQKTRLKWIPRSKSEASKSRPLWAAHTRIGNVWEYPPRAMRQRVRFSTQNQGFPCSLFLCELNFKRQLINAIGLYSQNLYQNHLQNHRVLRRSIYILSQTSPPVRNATYLRSFFQNLFMSLDFVNQHVFFAARFTLGQPKTPVRNTTNLRTFCFVDYHNYAFQENLCPMTLAHQIFVFYLSPYFYTSDTFRPILALFTQFTPHQFFLMYITTRNFFLSPMRLLLGI